MGNNSVFDQAGVGASDLGLAKDPDKIAAENQKQLEAQTQETERVEKEAEDTAAEQADIERMKGTRSRTLLTGGQGVKDEDLNVARRTLLGS